MVSLKKGEEISSWVEGLIYPPKQVREYSIDFTVSSIYVPEKRGELDFGGGEYSESGFKELMPRKNSKDDRYGWWELEPEIYLISFNETWRRSSEDEVGLLSPHPRLFRTFAFHPTLIVMEWKKEFKLPLFVGKKGLRIKQNARVSKLLIMR